MRSKPLYFSKEIDSLLVNKLIDTTTIKYFFIEGDVDFSRSNTKISTCKTYVIEAEFENKSGVLQVRNCQTKLEIQKFSWIQE